ncbi:MAG: hypothetical protein K9L26_05295 [Candidatus Izimaplasma sp.]|nr:hypothetical protein [Candidatus Izimaplasma bacterium]
MAKLKKLLKRLIIFLAIIGATYGVYTYLSTPDGFVSKEELVTSYFTHLDDPNVCDTHFNAETKEVCSVVQTTLSDQTIEIVSVVDHSTADYSEVILQIEDHEETFLVQFKIVEETGLKGYFNARYYLIDTIQ